MDNFSYCAETFAYCAETFAYCAKIIFNRAEVLGFGAISFDFGAIRFAAKALRFPFVGPRLQRDHRRNLREGFAFDFGAMSSLRDAQIYADEADFADGEAGAKLARAFESEATIRS